MSKYWITILRSKTSRLALTLDHLKLLTRPRAIDVIQHMSTHDGGSRFSDLNFDLRLNSGTLSRLLVELGEQGLVAKVGQYYQATTMGKRAVALCTEILSMRAPRNPGLTPGRRVTQ